VKIRLSSAAWGWGMDDFERVALPSLLQSDNIPALLTAGFTVVLAVYTVVRDMQRLRALLLSNLGALVGRSSNLDLRVEIIPERPVAAMKFEWLIRECEAGIREQAPVLIMPADAFWGNGSVRNLAEYCRKPGVVVGAPYMRVGRGMFFELMQQYRGARGIAPISNAKLVDIGLRARIQALRDSETDEDRNASFYTGASWRKLSENLYALVLPLITPLMFWALPSDIDFFNLFGAGRFEMFDHLWPAKLMAERRWRVMTSSDLAFLLEVTPDDVERELHAAYPLEEGRLYNDDYYAATVHTRAHQSVVMSVRREPFLS
jgi:hypothetical protein